MVIRRNYGLGGKFKLDVYNKSGELRYTTDYIDNFITSTGLNYIRNVGYADCFRYVSLGSGTTANSLTSNGGFGTTGLDLPIKQFLYIGGNTENSSCNTGGSNEYASKGCGYRINETGVTLTRAWRIPINENEFFGGPFTFKEYMVSPGIRGIPGYLWDAVNGYHFGTGCNCQTPVYTSNDGSDIVAGYGEESPDFAIAYPFLCNFDKAFSRIIKDVTVQTDEYLIINYALTVNLANSTGIRKFDVTVTRNSPVNDPDVGDPFNWVRVSGFSSLIHPGIKLINNGDVTSVAKVNQLNSYEFRAGESFVPPLGMAMEPSCPVINRTAYISNDDYQFKVNDISGGKMILDTYKPHNPLGRNFPSGTIAFHKNYISETSNSSSSLGTLSNGLPWYYRPRTSTVDSLLDGTNYPSQTDYSSPVISTDLQDSIVNPDTLDMTFKSQHYEPNLPVSITNTAYSAISERSREQTADFQFVNFETTFETGTPVRAFIYAYQYDDGDESPQDWYATLDAVIEPRNGNNEWLLDKTNVKYRASLALLKDSLSTSSGHYWMDTSNILQMQVKLNWSAPCPAEVVGC